VYFSPGQLKRTEGLKAERDTVDPPRRSFKFRSRQASMTPRGWIQLSLIWNGGSVSGPVTRSRRMTSVPSRTLAKERPSSGPAAATTLRHPPAARAAAQASPP